MHSRYAATLVALVLLFPSGASAADESPDLPTLKRAMEDTYLEIQRDFDTLRGPKAEDAYAALARTAAISLSTDPGRAPEVSWVDVARAWVESKTLGPIVAGRLAGAVRKAAGDAPAEAAIAASLGKAALAVFPEPGMADNWDRHFRDLEIVQRYAKARAGESPKEGTPAPAPPAPAADPEPDPADMVAIPAGELPIPAQRGRGWPDTDQKEAKRKLKAYYLDRTEVSGAAYAAFLRGLKDLKLRDRLLPSDWKVDEKGGLVLPDGNGRLPVTGVTYEGAARFAEAGGKRLPTEDEWERAARGDQGWKFPWGPEWAEGNAAVGDRKGPSPVGAMPGDRSPFGALDLCGNVSEFCATYVDGKPVKGMPKSQDQVVRRGGNFKAPADEAANDWRYVIGAAARSELVGFRCAMDETAYEKKFGKK